MEKENWKKICGVVIMNGKNKGKGCRRPNKYKAKISTSYEYFCGLHKKCYENHKIEEI